MKNTHKLFLIIILFLFCCIHTGLCGYTVTFGESTSPDADTSGADGTVTFRELPLWIQVSYISSLAAGFLAAVKFFPPVAGKVKYIFDNKKRQDIFNFISENPGKSLEEISGSTSLNRETLRHHIRVLRENNRIRFEKEGHSIRIFPNGGAFSGEERKIISICHNKTRADIIALVLKNPGIKNTDLKKELNLSKSTISWHLRQIERTEILSKKEEGRCRHYYIAKELEPAVARNLPVDLKQKYGL